MSPVMLELSCGGCDATETVGPLRRRFISLSGQDHGVGQFRTDRPQEHTPEGWVMFDLYTQCTYCPECWASIEVAGDARDGES